MARALRSIVVDLTPVLPGGENGGAKVFILELIRGMGELFSASHFTLLIREDALEELKSLESSNIQLRIMIPASDATPAPLAQSRGAVERAWGRVRRMLSSLLRAAPKHFPEGPSLLRELSADLLYCPFTDPTYYEPGIPTVSTLYDLQYKTYPQFFASADVQHRDDAFRRAVEKSTMIAAISDYARNSAIRYANIDSKKLRTIYIRLAQRVKEPASEAMLLPWGLLPQGYVIYPANFWQHKNHEVLLTALSLVRQRGLLPNVKLVLTGSPGERCDWLKMAAHRMGLGDTVIFPGYVSTEELGALISYSLGVVFPSLYEGFGMPVIEAMAMGVPVACSNLTSLPEVAGEAAIQFDPRIPADVADALVMLATDAPLRERLIVEGRKRAVAFEDHLLMVREYMSLFEEALEMDAPRNQVVGRYIDGWLGPKLWIQTEGGGGDRMLELDFSAEGWLPARAARLALLIDGKPRSKFKINQGCSQRISVPLGVASELLEFRFSPVYIPAEHGLGDDIRQLSLKLTGCRLNAGDTSLNLLDATS